MDNIQLSINFKSDPSKIRQIKLFSTFDYYVQSKLKMKQVGMLQLSVDSPMGASKITSNGHLELVQDKPPLIDSITRTIYDVDPLTDVIYSQYTIEELTEAYNHRNEKVNYVATNFVQNLGSRFSTTLEVNIHVPKSQEIVYRPGVLETIKFAWV